MIGALLKESLDPVYDGLNPGGRPNPKLEGSEQARESASWEKAEGKRRSNAKEDLGTRNGQE